MLEQALLHHLQALRDLPTDLIIPPRLVLARDSFERVTKLIEQPRAPTQAMRDLMAGKKIRRS